MVCQGPKGDSSERPRTPPYARISLGGGGIPFIVGAINVDIMATPVQLEVEVGNEFHW